MTAFGPAQRVPGTFLSTHLCCQTLKALLFLSALLAKPCSHRDNEGLICLRQYGAFLHNLHVFFKAQTLSNERTNSGAGSCSRDRETSTLCLSALMASSWMILQAGKVSLYPGLGRHLIKGELGFLTVTGGIHMQALCHCPLLIFICSQIYKYFSENGFRLALVRTLTITY